MPLLNRLDNGLDEIVDVNRLSTIQNVDRILELKDGSVMSN